MVRSKRTYGYTTRTTYRSQLNMGGTYMVEKIERICIVYGTKRMIERFLQSEAWSGGLGEGKETGLIEIDPKTEHFKELQHGLIHGFEE